MKIYKKEEFKRVVDTITSSKNDLLDEIYAIDCSLSFLNEATCRLMIDDNSNIMEEVSYGYSNQINTLRNNLKNLIKEFGQKTETSTNNLNSLLEELEEEEYEKISN